MKFIYFLNTKKKFGLSNQSLEPTDLPETTTEKPATENLEENFEKSENSKNSESAENEEKRDENDKLYTARSKDRDEAIDVNKL